MSTAPLPPAKHPLTISVEAGDSVDLLTATLDTSASVANEVHTHGWSEWVVWGSFRSAASGHRNIVCRSAPQTRQEGDLMMRKIDLHVLVAALALGLTTGTVLAHGDEDHSQDAKKKPPAAATTAASAMEEPQG
jgi:hypothetical protein